MYKIAIDGPAGAGKSTIAKFLAKKLNIDQFEAGLLPQEKFEIVQSRQSCKNIVCFVGDGFNDAPALASADVGISMGIMGSSATIEASDVVIADDNLKQIPNLIKISKKTKRIFIFFDVILLSLI